MLFGPKGAFRCVATAMTGRASVCDDAQSQLQVGSVLGDTDLAVRKVQKSSMRTRSSGRADGLSSWTEAIASNMGHSKSWLQDDGSSGMRMRRRTVARNVDHLVRRSAQTFSSPLIW